MVFSVDDGSDGRLEPSSTSVHGGHLRAFVLASTWHRNGDGLVDVFVPFHTRANVEPQPKGVRVLATRSRPMAVP
jgi:hypothetical protein